MEDCDIADPEGVRLSTEGIVCVRDGEPLEQHEHYILVPWMKPAQHQVSGLLEALGSTSDESNLSQGTPENLERVAAVILNHHLRFLGVEKTADRELKAMLNHWSQNRFVCTPVMTRTDAMNIVSVLTTAVTECMTTSIELPATMTFLINLLGTIGMCTVAKVHDANKTSRYTSAMLMKKIQGLLDPNVVAITNHPHRSTASQLKALAALRSELVTPAFPIDNHSGTGLPVSDRARETEELRNAIQNLAISCAQIGSTEQCLPYSIAIRVVDLRPNRHVTLCIDAIADAFGVQVKFTTQGTATFKLLDVGKFNGLLAWTASFSILHSASSTGLWASAASTVEGSDVRNYLANLTEAFQQHTGGKDDFMPVGTEVGDLTWEDYSEMFKDVSTAMHSNAGQDIATSYRSKLDQLRGMHAIKFLYACYHAAVTGKHGTPVPTESPANIFGHYVKTSDALLSFNMAVERVGFGDFFDARMRAVSNNDGISRHARFVLAHPDLCRWLQANVLSAFASAARHKAGGSYEAIKILQSTRMKSDFKRCILTDTEAMLMMYDEGTNYDDCMWQTSKSDDDTDNTHWYSGFLRAKSVGAFDLGESGVGEQRKVLSNVYKYTTLKNLAGNTSLWTMFYHVDGSTTRTLLSQIRSTENTRVYTKVGKILRGIQDRMTCTTSDFGFHRKREIHELLAEIQDDTDVVFSMAALVSSMLFPAKTTVALLADKRFDFLRKRIKNDKRSATGQTVHSTSSDLQNTVATWASDVDISSFAEDKTDYGEFLATAAAAHRGMDTNLDEQIENAERVADAKLKSTFVPRNNGGGGGKGMDVEAATGSTVTNELDEAARRQAEAARQAEEEAARRQAEAARKQAEEEAARKQAEEEERAKANEQQVIQATIAVESLKERKENFDENSAQGILDEFDVLESKHNAIRSLKSDHDTMEAYEAAYYRLRFDLLDAVKVAYEGYEEWIRDEMTNKLFTEEAEDLDRIRSYFALSKTFEAWLVKTINAAEGSGLGEGMEALKERITDGGGYTQQDFDEDVRAYQTSKAVVTKMEGEVQVLNDLEDFELDMPTAKFNDEFAKNLSFVDGDVAGHSLRVIQDVYVYWRQVKINAPQIFNFVKTEPESNNDDLEKLIKGTTNGVSQTVSVLQQTFAKSKEWVTKIHGVMSANSTYGQKWMALLKGDNLLPIITLLVPAEQQQ